MMSEDSSYDCYAFAIRDLQVVVDAFTGTAYRVDEPAHTLAGVGEEGSLRLEDGLDRDRLRPLLTPRARAQRQWRYPIDWSDAYVALHTSVFCNMACRYCQAAEHRRAAIVALIRTAPRLTPRRT